MKIMASLIELKSDSGGKNVLVRCGPHEEGHSTITAAMLTVASYGGGTEGKT